jgi:hypothetical protein
MKIEKFQLRGNSSLCAGAFQLLCGRVPPQPTANIGPYHCAACVVPTVRFATVV